MRRWMLVFAALGASACDAEQACLDFGEERFTASELSATSDFDVGAPFVESRFRFSLRGLPELLPPGPSYDGATLGASLTLSYPDGTVGELPRFRLLILPDDGAAPIADVASVALQQGPLRAEARVVRFCDGNDLDALGCCPREARACERTARVRITRLDGQPFPAVTATLTATGSASVSKCPLGAEDVEFEFEQLEGP